MVSGYGLAPVYIAPLSHFFLSHYGLEKTFLFFALISAGTLLVLSQVITNPPSSFSPLVLSFGKRKPISSQKELSVKEMVRSREFYLLWIILLAGTFSGLLVIGQMSKIAQEVAGLEQDFLPVMFYALANFAGRLMWGVLSDRIGRRKTLFSAFTIQAIIFFVFEQMTNPALLLLAKSGVDFTFGGMLALFPAICADYFGLKNLGLNYGVLFTTWGVGGTIGPLLGGLIRDITGVHTLSFFISGCVSVTGMILVNFLKTAERG